MELGSEVRAEPFPGRNCQVIIVGGKEKEREDGEKRTSRIKKNDQQTTKKDREISRKSRLVIYCATVN